MEQEGLAVLDAGLDEHGPDRDVAQDAAETFLERGAGTEDRDAAERNRELRAEVGELSSGRDGVRGVGEEGERFLDHERREAVREEDEVRESGCAVAQEGVNPLFRHRMSFFWRGDGMRDGLTFSCEVECMT